MTKEELIRTVAERFSTEPEYPWADENFIFRHRSNRKWFAVAMRVAYRRLGLEREGAADIVDVKCGPLLMDAYRRQPGILPGYHMNKDHWITILLDGSADDALIRELQAGIDQGTMADRIFVALGRLGLDFDPFYYRVYQKALDDDERYPRFYKDDVYNSLLFKLFNTAGELVHYDGHRTQWEYVPAGGALQKGDILFFTEPLEKGSSGVLDGYEFVVRGPYSGALTGCGVYMGDDQVLLLRGGQVKAVAWTEALQRTLDSARRIHLEVYDEKQMIVEDMIAQIYDCLGTPYSNFNRTGDFSFDCSGIISWCFERMELYPKGYVYYKFTETTASGRASITDYVWHGKKLVHMVVPVTLEDGHKSLDGFERGDIVFLLGSGGGKIGHVMVYLGDGRVIHSTYINSKYSGTVVANFRRALQKDYYTSLRIESVS